VARAEDSTLANMATAAHAYAAKLSWHEIAARTRSEMDAVLNCNVRLVLQSRFVTNGISLLPAGDQVCGCLSRAPERTS
jgi:hypothetical protein